MTDQERQQGFAAAVRTAELTYGLTVKAEVRLEQLGEAVLMRPSLVIVPIEGWQTPTNGNGTNTTPIPKGVNLGHKDNSNGEDTP